MKVLFINNYPMDHVWKQWQQGEQPGHHLWGITHLSHHDIEVEILPHQRFNWLNKVGRKLGLGDYLDQQLRILFSRVHYDVIYSACQTNTFLLSLLRSWGLFRTPIVALIHHPPQKIPANNRTFLQGHDKLLCLSSTVMEQLQQTLLDEKLALLQWGADLPFYDSEETESDASIAPFFISAGKTERDHTTLAQAFIDIPYPLKIYCSATTTPAVAELPHHITVLASDSQHNPVSYKHLLQEYRQAYAIAIPLSNTDNLAGLTSLLDAMAVGKPVIMTRNAHIDIDIETEGIGIWVEPGDVAGWQQAIRYLIANPDQAVAMGKRGRILSETRYNLEQFSSALASNLAQMEV